MASLNRATLIGNLGRAPETKYLPSGEAVTNIAIATTETWKDKTSGEKKEATEWHRVSFFGKLAEIAGQYLVKGSQVYVEGKIKTRKWTDKDGVERFTTEIVADTMKMLGGRPNDGDGQQRAPQRQASGADYQRAKNDTALNNTMPRQSTNTSDDMDDDIPF